VSALAEVLAREGFRETIPSKEELFNWPCIVHFNPGGLNLCINRTVLLEFLAMGLVAVVFILAFRRPRLVPRGLQNVMEGVYDFIARDVVQAVMGREGATWQPYFMVLFAFAFAVSILEIIPGLQFPASSRIAVPAFLAIGSWLIYNYAGIKQKGFVGYLRYVMFPAGVPWPAYILLTPIELATALILRPFTLAIRLFANFLAGHVLLVVFLLATAYLIALPITIPFAVGALAMAVMVVALEIFVAAVQAYVFTILTAVFIQLATAEEH
jgi:F-type H+-transporting ATPase subunit a